MTMTRISYLILMLITVLGMSNFAQAQTNIYSPIATIDQVAYQGFGTPIVINVLANDWDIEGQNISLVEVENGDNGNTFINYNSTITYLPNFFGDHDDVFFYKICDDGMPQLCEWGSVYIIDNDGFAVSNLFDFPIGQNDCFCPSDFNPVCVNGTTYQNPCIAACNGYSNPDFGACSPGDITEMFVCENDCVWPGDINNDGQVNLVDIFSFTLVTQRTGFARLNQSDEWSGYYSADWPYNLSSGLNYKFADCNGDGMINNDDLAVIQANLGSNNYSGSGDLPTGYFAMDLEVPPTAIPGDTVEIPIILGTALEPINVFYNLAINLEYAPGTVVANSAKLSFKDTWLANPKNIQHLIQDFPTAGRTEAGISTANNQPSSGHGKVATFSFVMEENLVGFTNDTPIALRLNMPPNTQELSAFYQQDNQLVNVVVPDELSESTNELRLINYLGQTVFYENRVMSSTLSIPTNHLPPGVYILYLSGKKTPTPYSKRLIIFN